MPMRMIASSLNPAPKKLRSTASLRCPKLAWNCSRVKVNCSLARMSLQAAKCSAPESINVPSTSQITARGVWLTRAGVELSIKPRTCTFYDRVGLPAGQLYQHTPSLLRMLATGALPDFHRLLPKLGRMRRRVWQRMWRQRRENTQGVGAADPSPPDCRRGDRLCHPDTTAGGHRPTECGCGGFR